MSSFSFVDGVISAIQASMLQAYWTFFFIRGFLFPVLAG
jgi:small basic protein